MLAVSNSFLEVIESPADGTQPHRTTFGVSFSLGASNTMGSYAQFLDGSTDWPAGFGDGYGILISVSTVAVSTNANNALVTIGIDLSGGTTYTDWISNLLVSQVGITTLGICEYYFPIRVPNGASLAIKGQSSNASPIATSYMHSKIYGKPTHPELIRAGSFVETFGADTANSAGTSVTCGTGSDGTYVQLGSALSRKIWGWEYGVGTTSAALTAHRYHTDIAVGDASNKRRVIRNAQTTSSTAETMDKRSAFSMGDGASGDIVYGRMQGSTALSGASLIAYGVGG